MKLQLMIWLNMLARADNCMFLSKTVSYSQAAQLWQAHTRLMTDKGTRNLEVPETKMELLTICSQWHLLLNPFSSPEVKRRPLPAALRGLNLFQVAALTAPLIS